MRDKIAIVTGASGNLGQAMVKKFLNEGYKVIGTVIPGDPIKIDVDSPGFEAEVVNLIDEDNSLQFIESVIKKHGGIDAAVLTVGGFAMGTIAETNTTDILKQYKLNFETAYNVARPSFIQMLKQGSGRIFMIGSRPGLNAKDGKGMVAYGLGKSLLFRLADLMNDEAKGHNVVTSVVIPSTIDTPQNRKGMPDADPSGWVKAEAIADIIYFYCTREASALREPVLKIYNKA
ncbi:MAG: SDR family NAD(P)-dependent oxidoreductase [Bacteroidota bacterium]